jgi:hypothetical protein
MAATSGQLPGADLVSAAIDPAAFRRKANAFL